MVPPLWEGGGRDEWRGLLMKVTKMREGRGIENAKVSVYFYHSFTFQITIPSENQFHFALGSVPFCHQWRPTSNTTPRHKSIQSTRQSTVLNDESYLQLFVFYLCANVELWLIQNNNSCVMLSTCIDLHHGRCRGCQCWS
jgi:hypothetical protein